MENNETLTAPPLGLVPKFIRQEQRLREITEAIERYKSAAHPVPSEWIDEKEEIEAYLSLRNQQNKGDIVMSSDSPIHVWFGLSYAQYLAIPRTVLQSMPIEWQRVFVRCLNQLDETIDWMPKEGTYRVQLMTIEHNGIADEDVWGDELHDELADYQRGRRKLPLKTRTKSSERIINYIDKELDAQLSGLPKIVHEAVSVLETAFNGVDVKIVDYEIQRLYPDVYNEAGYTGVHITINGKKTYLYTYMAEAIVKGGQEAAHFYAFNVFTNKNNR